MCKLNRERSIRADDSSAFGRNTMLGKLNITLTQIVCALFVFYIVVILCIQSSIMLDTSYLHEEFRPLFTAYVKLDPASFSGNYVSQFVSSFKQPLLYDYLTRAWLWVGGDLVIWHRVLSLAAWLTFLAGIAVAARLAGNTVTAIIAVGVAVAQPIFLYQITSAVPHALAFPILAWAIVALFRQSLIALAGITLLSGMLYIAVTPLLGLLLTWQLFLVHWRTLQSGSTKIRALAVLGCVGVASLWFVAGSLHAPDDFGQPLQPMQFVEKYPENGPDGRHFYGIFNPVKYVAARAILQFRDWVGPHVFALVFLNFVVATCGYFSLQRADPIRKAVLAYVLCSASIIILVYATKPFLIYRFLLYPGFAILPLLFALGIQQYCRWLERIVPGRDAIAVVLAAAFALTFNSTEPKKMGYLLRLDADDRRVIDFAAAQPSGTLFAAWPSSESTFEYIPYFARRPLLVMQKLHYPVFEQYTLGMRARTFALIDAYFATDASDLQALHDRWGVDYLIVEKPHFTSEEDRPRYFSPFNERIDEIWEEVRPNRFLLRNPPPRSIALETDDAYVIRLGAFARKTGLAGQ